MSTETPSATPGSGELQLDRAEFAEPPSPTPSCDVCDRQLLGHYFEINGKMACESCRYQVEAELNQRGGAGGFLRAGLAGLGAAAAGSALYYAVREGTGYEFGLISILVGFAVGYAVRWGSRGKGGWAYQTLAIFLTYMAIVSTYIPLIITEITKQAGSGEAVATESAPAGGDVRPIAASAAAPGPAADPGQGDLTLGGAVLGIGGLFLLAMALPFLAGFENLIGLAIIAFGLYEAWKLNRRTALSIAGPFQIGAAPPTTA